MAKADNDDDDNDDGDGNNGDDNDDGDDDDNGDGDDDDDDDDDDEIKKFESLADPSSVSASKIFLFDHSPVSNFFSSPKNSFEMFFSTFIFFLG